MPQRAAPVGLCGPCSSRPFKKVKKERLGGKFVHPLANVSTASERPFSIPFISLFWKIPVDGIPAGDCLRKRIT
jgi:hypothetical protein